MVTQASPAVIRPVTPGDISMGRYGRNLGTGSSTADTAAFHDACQDVFDAGGGVVKVPPGRFLIDTPYVSTADIGTADRNGVAIKGQGHTLTTFETNSGLFSWTQAVVRDVSTLFEDFAVEFGNATNNGTIINVTQPAGGLALTSRNTARNLRMRASDLHYETAYADKCIDFSNTFFPDVFFCSFSQAQGGTVARSITRQGTAMIDVDDSYGPRVSFCKIWGAGKGISHVRTSLPGERGGEGGRFHNNEIVHSNIGIHSNGAGGREPGLYVTENHINAWRHGLLAENIRIVWYNDNAPYNEGTTEPYDDARFVNCDSIMARGNIFWFSSNTSRNNFSIDATTTNFAASNNRHVTRGTGYLIEDGAADIVIDNPIVHAELDRLVSDGASGGTPSLYISRIKPLALQWRLSADQAITDSTDTALVWGVEDEDTAAIGTPGEVIQVPADEGIRRAHFEVGVTWQDNSTGARTVRITKNAANVFDAPDMTVAAAFQTGMTLTGSMSVRGGDNLRVVVRQSSGGNLPALSSLSFVRVTFT